MLERRTGKVATRWRRDAPARVSNLLLNGNFEIAQRGDGPHTAAAASISNTVNNDDAYILDMWNLLSDGNDTVDVSRSTTGLPSGSASSIILDVETANKKFGICQYLENKETIPLQDQTLSLSFKAKVTGSSITSIRAAILSWVGTADSVTSDVVSTWEAAGVNPVLVASWAYENTPASLSVTTSWQTFKIEGVAFDTASSNNLAVFIWSDDVSTTVGDFLHITDVNLELAATATDFVRRTYSQELERCQRYFIGVRDTASTDFYIAVGYASSTSTATCIMNFQTIMRTSPTATYATPSAFDLAFGTGAGGLTVTSVSTGLASPRTMSISAGGAASMTDGEAVSFKADGSGTAFVFVSAEL